MILNGFKFEYEVCPDREGNSTIQLLLEINNDKYILLCNNRNNICKIDITSKVDAFCKGLLKMNINEWNQKNMMSRGSSFQVFIGIFRFQRMV